MGVKRHKMQDSFGGEATMGWEDGEKFSGEMRIGWGHEG